VSSVDTVANRLDNLASKRAYHNFSADLRRLAADLRAGNAAAWRRVDLVSYFDANSVVGRARGVLAAASRHVEIVRNVLLFTPLFFTWVGIFAAVQAYRELLAAPWEEQKQFEDASFLQLWTRGFGDRTWWTLDHVAMCDFVALAAVIVMFLLGSSLQNRTAAIEEKDRMKRLSELRSVLVDAGLALREEGSELVDRMSASLRSLLPEYQRTVQQLVAAQQEMSNLVTNGKDNISLMVRATGELAISSTTIAESAKSMESPTGQLAGHVHGVENATRDLAANLGHVANGITSAKDGMADVVKGAGDLNRELRDVYANRIEELRQESTAHAATVGELIEARRELNRSIESGRVGVAQWVRGTAAIAASGSSIVDSTNELREHVAALRAASEKFDQTVGSMVSGTQSFATQLPSAQKGVLEVLASVLQLSKKLDGVHERQERLTANIAALADNPQAAASAAKRTAETARDAEVALRQAVEALPGQMDQLRVAVVEAFDRELEHRRAAADSLGASVGEFNGTAGETAQALREAVEGLHSAPTLMLPELRTASQDLAEALDQCRGLVAELVAANGKKRRRFFPLAARGGR
jgi:methyl-accepting chemotaxis protein